MTQRPKISCALLKCTPRVPETPSTAQTNPTSCKARPADCITMCPRIPVEAGGGAAAAAGAETDWEGASAAARGAANAEAIALADLLWRHASKMPFGKSSTHVRSMRMAWNQNQVVGEKPSAPLSQDLHSPSGQQQRPHAQVVCFAPQLQMRRCGSLLLTLQLSWGSKPFLFTTRGSAAQLSSCLPEEQAAKNSATSTTGFSSGLAQTQDWPATFRLSPVQTGLYPAIVGSSKSPTLG
mmetsp:Transcript_31094/g.46937  ORF Transcript_31094/g.46937 Transcript_31094/m.46937 type:complete len:238 (+) Transcript_31094:428-1141(+)